MLVSDTAPPPPPPAVGASGGVTPETIPVVPGIRAVGSDSPVIPVGPGVGSARPMASAWGGAPGALPGPVPLFEAELAAPVVSVPAVLPPPQPPPDPSELARRLFGQEAFEADALASAVGFELSLEQRSRDSADLEACGSLRRLVESRNAERAVGRLSQARLATVVERVGALLLPEEREAFDYNASVVMERVADGVRLFTPEGFSPNGAPPSQRATFKRLAKPITKLAASAWSKGFLQLLPTKQLVDLQAVSGERYHWSPAGLAPKRGKPEGRMTFDPRDMTEPRDVVRATAMAQYCERGFNLPRLTDLIEMVLSMEAEHGNANLELFKVDLSGAFHLVTLSPESALLMACEVGEGYTAVFNTGNFGHVFLPYIFNTVSKVLEIGGNALGRESSAHRYKLKVYVDDLIGLQRLSDGASEGCATRVLADLIRSLLGPDSVSSEKTEKGRRLLWIGWMVDLDARSVMMGPHILLKLVYHLDLARGRKVPIGSLEVIAALTERFSAVCPILRVFRHALYGAYCDRNRRHPEQRINITPLVSTVIGLVSAVVREAWSGYGCSFDRFRPRPPDTVIEFDGSIYGLGGRVFELDAEGIETLVLELSWPLPDSVSGDPLLRTQAQNSCELLAAVATGLAALFVLRRSSVYRLRGDSLVALSWMDLEHFASPLSSRTALAWSFLAYRFGVVVADTVHLPKESNTVCDAFSRRLPPSARPGVTVVTPGLCNSSAAPASVMSFCSRLVELCEPTAARCQPLTTTADIQGLLGAIMSLPPPFVPSDPPPFILPFAPPSWFL